MVNIENHENRFADMERGRDVDGLSERGRLARCSFDFPPAGRAACFFLPAVFSA
jgi:hypothetical protein